MGALVRDCSLLRGVYFDGGWSPELNLSEGVVLIAVEAYYWMQLAPSSAPEAELKTAVLAAERVRSLIGEGQFNQGTIFGDNKQAVGLLKTQASHLRQLAKRRDEISKTIPDVKWEHIPRERNLAGKVIEKIQQARAKGQPVPERVEIYFEGQVLGVQIMRSSMTPLSTVGSNWTRSNLPPSRNS